MGLAAPLSHDQTRCQGIALVMSVLMFLAAHLQTEEFV